MSDFAIRDRSAYVERFDVYTGVMFSKVDDGMSSGYLHTSTADPMVGFRFKF